MTKRTDLNFSDYSPFRELDDKTIQALKKRVKIFQYNKKQFIYREGFPPAGIFIIIKGKAKVFKTTFNGKELILLITREHDLLGLSNLVSNTDYSTSACATESTELVFLPMRDFTDLMSKSASFSMSLMKSLSNEYERVAEKLADVATKQVRRRVAEMLMRMMKKYGIEKDNQTLKIILSREDMAGLVATNTETLVRTLSEFKKEKLVALKGKKIALINLPKLMKVSATY
jgi:CRP/FNR family transcriptional regulator, polysaccharide utilization system transcription regulator